MSILLSQVIKLRTFYFFLKKKLITFIWNWLCGGRIEQVVRGQLYCITIRVNSIVSSHLMKKKNGYMIITGQLCYNDMLSDSEEDSLWM